MSTYESNDINKINNIKLNYICGLWICYYNI